MKDYGMSQGFNIGAARERMWLDMAIFFCERLSKSSSPELRAVSHEWGPLFRSVKERGGYIEGLDGWLQQTTDNLLRQVCKPH